MTGTGAGDDGGAGHRRGTGFEFVEGATADLAFVARGPTPGAVFAAAAEALLAATVEHPEGVGGSVRCPVSLAEAELDLLLLRWLDELIWRRDAEQLLARAGRLSVQREGDAWRLEGELVGEPIGPGHRLRADVKAATAHGLWMGQIEAGWEARVTLDV
jgi:SHS2 domain-containing protein